jgi:hypothetical protein
MTDEALQIIFDAIQPPKQKNGDEDDDEEEDEDGDDEEDEEMEAEDESEDEDNENEESDDDNEVEPDDNEDEDDGGQVNDEFRDRVKSALGEHAAESDEVNNYVLPTVIRLRMQLIFCSSAQR